MVTEYNLTSGTAQSNDAAAAHNDTVRTRSVFDNYFAYDDGTAERRVGVSGAESQIAVQYRLEKADTLKAVQFHFPYFKGNNANQSFRLRVWVADLDNTPEYESGILEPFYPDGITDTFQAFTTYVLYDDVGKERMPIAIPAGDFYVGLSLLTSSGTLPIGFDANRPAGKDFGFYNIKEGWVPFNSVADAFFGSLMIRPVVGAGKPVHTPAPVRQVDADFPVIVYPNPAKDVLRFSYNKFLSEKDVTLEVYSSIGQAMYTGVLQEALDVHTFLPGVYYVRITTQEKMRVFSVVIE